MNTPTGDVTAPAGKLLAKTVLITGASSGMGRLAALAFAREGANLVLAARSGDLLDELRAECGRIGVEAITVAVDVGDREALQTLCDTAVGHFGRVDVWINNAGVAAVGRFEEIPIQDHEKVVQTDLMGVLYGSHIALRLFHSQSWGTVINVASMIGKLPTPYYASYTAAKFGVVGLGAALRQELAQQGVADIRVCTVLPMAMDTQFFAHAANYSGREAVAIPPVSDPDEVVQALLRLALEPEDEVIVGTGGSSAEFVHRALPAVASTLMGINTHVTQMEHDTPQARHSGTVHTPVSDFQTRGRTGDT